jgi:hypothetical protein
MSTNLLYAFLGFLIACLCMFVHAVINDFRTVRRRREIEAVRAKVKAQTDVRDLHVTVTSDEKGVCAITLTNDEGEIKHVLWERQ